MRAVAVKGSKRVASSRIRKQASFGGGCINCPPLFRGGVRRRGFPGCGFWARVGGFRWPACANGRQVAVVRVLVFGRLGAVPCRPFSAPPARSCVGGWLEVLRMYGVFRPSAAGSSAAAVLPSGRFVAPSIRFASACLCGARRQAVECVDFGAAVPPAPVSPSPRVWRFGAAFVPSASLVGLISPRCFCAVPGGFLVPRVAVRRRLAWLRQSAAWCVGLAALD